MTRSIGDFDLKPYGVTAKPEYSYKKVSILNVFASFLRHNAVTVYISTM